MGNEVTKEQLDAQNLWLRSMLITLMAAITLEVLLVIGRTIYILADRQSISPFIPWTFHTAWELGFLALIAYLVKRCGTTFGNFIAGVLIIGIASMLLWSFLPQSFHILHARYFGVEYRRTMAKHDEGPPAGWEYNESLNSGSLYNADDPRLNDDYKDRAKDNEYVGTGGFLFWQAGLAAGYDPSELEEYSRFLEPPPGKKGELLLSRVELFFTVGPLVLAESTITAIFTDFPVFVIVICSYYIIKRRHIWY